MLAQPWQQPEAGNVDERRLSDLVALWYGRHGQTLTDGDRRRDKLVWLAEALGNPGDRVHRPAVCGLSERRLAGELYVPGQRKQVSPTTINRELLYLQAVFNELGRLGSGAHGNPLEVLRQYKVQELSWRSSIRMKSNSCWQRARAERLVADCDAAPFDRGALVRMEKLTCSQVGIGRLTFTRTKGKKNRTVPVAELAIGLVAKRTGRLFGDCYAEFEKAGCAAGITPAGWPAHPCAAPQLCQPLHDGRWQHPGAAAHPRPHRHQDDHALCPFAPDHLGRCGQTQPDHRDENGGKIGGSAHQRHPITPPIPKQNPRKHGKLIDSQRLAMVSKSAVGNTCRFESDPGHRLEFNDLTHPSGWPYVLHIIGSKDGSIDFDNRERRQKRWLYHALLISHFRRVVDGNFAGLMLV